MAKTGADVFKRIYVDGFIYNQSGNDEPNEHGILPIDTIWNTGQLPNRPLGLDLDETVFFDTTVKRVPSSNGSTKFVADIEKRWFNNNESYKTFRYQHIIVTPYLQTEEIWFGFSLLFPEDFDPDTHETIVYNFGGVGGGAFSLRVNNGYFHLSISRLDENTTSNRLIFVLEEANGGVWHDFIIKAKWSSNTADGELTVWKNGKLARLYNPVTRQKWVIPTSTTSGIQSQYIAFQQKGYINQTVEDEGSTVSVLNWKGFTLGINEGGIDHNFRTGFYYSGWNTNIDPVTGEVRPETYEEGDPLYIEPNMRIREMWTSNVGWQPKNSYTENFSHEDFYTSLDANNQLPLEKPNWWEPMVIKSIYQSGFTYNPTQDENPVVPAIVDVVQGESQMANPATDVIWDSGLGAAKFFMDFEAPTQTGSTIAGRTEHTSRYPPVMEAEEMWFSASYYFPVGEAVDPEDEIIYQWHVGAITGSPNFALRRKNGRFVVYLWLASGFENQMAFDVGPATNDTRHDFVVYLFMHPTDGHLTVWKDGMLARCHNPLTGAPWSVPTSPPGGGITNDYTAYPALGAIQQEDEGVSLLVWNGKTARGTYPNTTKYPKWGMYKPAWGTRYNPDKSIKPEAYDPLDPLYVAPEFREKTIYINNIKFETRLEEFTNEEIFQSLDIEGNLPLEIPNWWGDVPVDMFALEVRENPIEWGTAVDLTNESPYPEGTEVELQATPETWTQFYRWSRDGVTLSTNQNYLYTTRGQNDLVLGEFQPKQYPLVVTVTPIGGGTVNIESGNYTEGQPIGLVATSNAGYTFLNWQKNGVVLSTNPSYTHTKTAGNETIVANFVLAKHQLTVTAGTGGTATGGGSFSQGETTSLVATVAEGYQFDGWYRDNVKLSGDNPYTYTARNQADTVQARFLRKSVAVISADPESGTKPLTVQFSSSGSVADSYAWDFGNGSTSFLALPYTVYQDAGTYTVTLTTTYGTLTDTATMEITVTDPVYVPPTIKITSPQNLSANFEAPAKLPFRVIANSELGISKVEYWVNDDLIATVTNAPYSYDWNNVEEGTYSIVAKAFDAEGSTESDPVSVTVYPPSEKYKLNGKELSDFGIIAGRAPNSNISVSGHLDFPKRMGKSFHVWDDEEGVEPYVSYDEIKFEGRDIRFHGYVEGSDKNDVMRKLYTFYDYLNTLNGEVLFSCKWGSWLVIVQSEVEATQIKAGMVSIVVTFRQTDTGIQPIQSGGTADRGIDGINFGNLGFTYMNLKNQWYRPTTKDHHAIGYFTEPFQVTKAGAREMVLSGLFETETYQEMVSIVSSLYSLFAKEGVRTLQINNEPFREFFVKDGFQVTNIIIKHGKCMALLSINMMELNKPVFDPDFFTDTDGNYILSNTNQKIIIRK